MPTMSYCLFQNTLGDLEDCYAHMDDKLSKEEQAAMNAMIELCLKIVEEYAD